MLRTLPFHTFLTFHISQKPYKSFSLLFQSITPPQNLHFRKISKLFSTRKKLTMSSYQKISTHLGIFFIVIVLGVTNVNSASRAPAPAVDCSSVILNLVDCLSFVTNGSTVKKPEGKCCSGLKTVLKTNAECLCEGFKNSAQFGVALNVTKAVTLPAACKISAPSVSNCGISVGQAPAHSPMAMPPSSISESPSSIGVHGAAPAPSPGSSSTSSALAVSASWLVPSVIVVSFSFF